MRASKTFSQSEKQAIIDGRLSGMDWHSLAKSIGTGRRQLQRAIDTDDFFIEYRNTRKFQRISMGEEHREELRVLIEERGKTAREAGFELGLSKEIVQKRMSRWGIKSKLTHENYRRPGKIDEAELARIKSYLDEGYNYNQVAELTGHGSKAISNHFPGRQQSQKVSYEMRMLEKNGMKKINEVWGLPNVA